MAEISSGLVVRGESQILDAAVAHRVEQPLAGSKTGGERAAATYAVIEICKANGHRSAGLHRRRYREDRRRLARIALGRTSALALTADHRSDGRPSRLNRGPQDTLTPHGGD